MSQLIHPVDPKRITDTFGTRNETRVKLGLGPHRGVDYGVPVGTPLKAVGKGTIVKVYHSEILGWTIELRTYVTAEKVRIFSYSHLDHVTIKEGTQVQQGDIIGVSGNSGKSSGPHLHLMAGKSEHLAVQAVEDPLQWLPKIGKK